MKIACIRNLFGLPELENIFRERIGLMCLGRGDPKLSRLAYFLHTWPNCCSMPPIYNECEFLFASISKFTVLPVHEG